MTNPRRSKKAADKSAAKAAKKLDTLIAAKKLKSAVKDGRLEVALSIASVTTLVKVDASVEPFETEPDDLFDRTFNDPGVGMSDDHMPIFKANLTILLPTIREDIAEIPENSNVVIDQVAEFVRLALLAARQGSGS